ncbi:hypothetical protein B0H12DRAFT_144264 [Mycena haematopus]|nr:hypothetical protein B0H12DRAFT_144264 [Mycena haematopus]
MTHFLRSRSFLKLLPPLSTEFRVSKHSFGQFLRPPHGCFFSSFTRVRRELFEEHLTYGPTQRTDVKLLNQQLVDSVNQENFPGAERLRLHLESEFAPIDPNPVYERAALAQIRWPDKQDLQAFLTWLHLVPDNEDPSRVENGPLTKTRNSLFRTGNPARNLLLLTEFSLVCAAKGYGQLVWDDLVLLMSRFEHADQAIAFFRSFETALLKYYSKYHPGFVEEAASRQRYLLILLCCEAGWLEEAVQIVQDSSAYRILGACEQLIAALRARNDLANIALVETCLQGRRRTEALPLTKMSDDHTIPKPTIAQRISDLFGPLRAAQPSSSSSSPSSSSAQFYSTRAVIERKTAPRSRTWTAIRLRQLKRAILDRSLAIHEGSGKTLHQLMAHYSAYNGHSRGVRALRRRALSASDPSSYTWLCKELYYLHESRQFADIAAVFEANFHDDFLPPLPWRTLRAAAAPTQPWRTVHTVPTKMNISNADSWIIWNALVRLSVSVADPPSLPMVEDLHHSVVHFASKLTDRQFQAFPTSYTTVFRSIVWAYSELSEMDKAVAAAGDLSLIGKLHMSSVGIFDELAAAHARSRNVPAATQLLLSLEEFGPRLATYGVMMDAYLQADLVDEALKLETRMKQKCEYIPGRNWRMDATLNALHAVEDALDPELI